MLQNNTFQLVLLKDFSVYRVKLCAILGAVDMSNSFSINVPQIIIYNDLHSVWTGLKHFSSFDQVVNNIIKWLHTCQQLDRRFVLCWIPVHIRLADNEQVDRLAKDAGLINIVRERVFSRWYKKWVAISISRLAVLKMMYAFGHLCCTKTATLR